MTGPMRSRESGAGRVPVRHNGFSMDASVVEDAFDPVLEAQLAHLDAIERRQQQSTSDEAELTGSAHSDVTEIMPPERAWPEAIPAPPAPEADLSAHLAWLGIARDVLGARAARNRDEVQRLSSQWLVAQRHLERVRPEEVSALVENQARLRERIAADEIASRLLRTLGAQLAAWEAAHPAPDAPLVQADLALVRRLLDESAEQRARAARELTASVLEVLCGVALDMEVVQRQLEHEPGTAAGAFHDLTLRITDAVDDLRALPHTEVVTPLEHEALHLTLRRCADRHRARLVVDLAWSGAEPEAEEVRAAVAWVAQEFLVAAVEDGAASAGMVLSGDAGGTLLALRVDPPIPMQADGDEPGWLLRCRARAAVAGGTLTVSVPEDRCALAVRFP